MKLDNRIKLIIYKEKVGAAILRNRGILESKGKYLSFFDGDDIFEEQMLEKAYYLAEDGNLDIAIYQHKHVNSEMIYSEHYNDISISYKKKYCKKAFRCTDYLPIEMIKFMGIKQDKLFRRKFIVDNRIEFQSLSCCNDTAFCTIAFMLSDRNRVLEDGKVYYFNRDHREPSRISYHRDPMCSYEALLFIEKYLKDNDLFEKYADYYFYFVVKLINAAGNDVSLTHDEKVEFRNFIMTTGINNIIKYSEGIFDRIEPCIKELFRQILNNEKLSFSHKEYVIESFIGKIKKCCKETNDKSGKVILWGIGENAKAIMKYFENHNIKIDYLVDFKLTEIDGRRIYKIDEVNLGMHDLIIPSGKKVYNDIHDKYDNVLNYFPEFM